MVSLSTHRAKRLTRLSGLVPLGTCVAILGNWVLWLPTMPLISAAKVVKCLTTLPLGTSGEPCIKALRMARYRRRLSLIACSFWIGHSLQREYTMSQSLNYLSPKGLEKCPVEKA